MPVRIIQAAPVMTLFTMFSMKGHEMEIFGLLSARPMTIKELQKESKMSERQLRTYLEDLTERKFISKKVVEDQRLKYVYYANPPETILSLAKETITAIERKRVEMKRDIVSGSKEHTKWRK